MNTPGSRKWSASRIRSPSSAPRVKGLDGSTEITPTVSSSARTCVMSAPISDDLPTPGGPVIPIAKAEPVSGYSSWSTRQGAVGSRLSTSEIARATARLSPARTPATSWS